MEDKPLLHSGQLDDLILEYLFRHGHGFSFPVKNPHEKTATTMMTKVKKSTIRMLLQVLLAVRVRS